MSKSEWADEPSHWRDECNQDELNEYVRKFEHTYNVMGSAELAEFLPPRNHQLYALVLRELVRVDLEYGWERGCPKTLEQYQRAFPELRSDRDGLKEVAFEEFRLRKQAGESPTTQEYLDRFGVTFDTRGGRLYSAELSAYASRSLSSVSQSGRPRGRFSAEIPGLPQVGEDFLGFRLIGELGRGSFGRVYLAQQGQLANRPIVLKVTTDRHDEAQTLAQLRHDNIVPIYSSHTSGPLRAVCMPYLGSVTLRDVFDDLKAQGSLPGSGRGLLSSLAKSSVRKSAGGSSVVSAPVVEPTAPESPEATDSTVRPKAEAAGTLGMLAGLSYVGAVVWMASKLVDGLAHAHDRGILHRDMKPANILLTDDGQPMLLDFNLAEDLKRRPADPEARESTLGGTLAYMSPEHLEAFQSGERPVDARSDLYSFGVILFEMLTGTTPFPVREGSREGLLATMLADRTGPPPSLRRWNPSVSPAVESVVRRCLEPDPARRYGSARELAEDLGRHLTNHPLKYAPERSHRERATKFVRRHPWLTTLVFVATAISSLLGGLAFQAKRIKTFEAAAALKRFDDRMHTAQYLLNAWMHDANKRGEGIVAAREAMATLHAIDNPSWMSVSPVARLPAEDQARVRDAVTELHILLAWGEVQEGVAASNPAVRERRLREALRINEYAEETTTPRFSRAAIWRQRAEVMERLGDQETARDLAAKAGALPLIDARDHTLMGVDLVRSWRYIDALDHFRKARQLDANNFGACFGAALCYERLSSPGEAEMAYATCIAIRKDDPAAWFNRGIVRCKQKKFAEAELDLRQAARLVPGDPDVVANLAVVALQLKKYREASAGFTHALALGSPMTRLYFLRAKAREGEGDNSGARADFAEGLRLTPSDASSWTTRGQAHIHQGESLRALATGSSVSTLIPIAQLEREEYTRALSDYDAALVLDPVSYPALMNRAYVLSEKLGRTEDAVETYDRILKNNPQFCQGLAERGVLRARLMRDEEARADATQARQLGPTAPIFYKLACLYALTSRRKPSDKAESYLLLEAAFHGGYGRKTFEEDPDLKTIRDDPVSRRLIAEAKAGKLP